MKAASANAQLPIILSTQLLGFHFTRPMSHVTLQWDAAREDSKRATVLHLFGSRPNFQRASHLAFTRALSESLYECHFIALKAHFWNSRAIWMYKEAWCSGITSKHYYQELSSIRDRWSYQDPLQALDKIKSLWGMKILSNKIELILRSLLGDQDGQQDLTKGFQLSEATSILKSMIWVFLNRCSEWLIIIACCQANKGLLATFCWCMTCNVRMTSTC